MRLITHFFLVSIIAVTCINCSKGQYTEKLQSVNNNAEAIPKKLNQIHQFKVQGCAVNYNGTDLYMSSNVQPWIKALGNNFRKVESTDGLNPVNLYIYDDIGVRLVERKSDFKIDSFRFRFERPEHDIRKETDLEIAEELKKINTEQVRTIFNDAIELDGILIGAYPMSKDVKNLFRHAHKTSYEYTAQCNTNQAGDYFHIALSTSFNEPEIIDSLHFYNYFDNIRESRGNKSSLRKDESGRIICDEYYDTSKMAVVPLYCTEDK